MKIGLLTQPLRNNYGGLLQAWALQKILTEMGHNCIIVNREYLRFQDLSLPHRIVSRIKSEINILLGRQKRINRPDVNQTNYIRKNILQFINHRYKGISPDIHTDSALRKYITAQAFDAFVVGSDQVWRPCYSPSIGNYFLDFLPPRTKAKRIAYAASFGVDTREYTAVQTKTYAALAQKFDLITVREKSGVNLVRKYLKSKAQQVLDPTMLLSKSDYEELLNNPTVKIKESDGQLFCYVLDPSNEMTNTINSCSKTLGYKEFFCNRKQELTDSANSDNIDEYVIPAIEQWIKSFADADMVITDSFHGCVFSIIFNKPFWVITNYDRGIARFTSLLDTFGLKDRIVNLDSNINWQKPIDWERINKIRHRQALTSKRQLEIFFGETY